MQRFKKALRLLSLALLLSLASLGVTLGGGVPVLSNKRKEDRNEVKIELVETREKHPKPEERNHEDQLNKS